MGLALRNNLDTVFGDMDRYVAAAKSVAAVRVLNALRPMAQTAGLRKISDIYGIGPRTTEQYATVKDATQSDLEASITVKGRGFPLSAFSPVQTPTGVSVLIKGRRVTIPHAFMVQRFGKHVFARGAYLGKSGGLNPTGETFGRFAFGRGRLPIQELYTFGPAEAFANPDVTNAMLDRVEEQAPKVIARELAAVKRGF